MTMLMDGSIRREIREPPASGVSDAHRATRQPKLVKCPVCRAMYAPGKPTQIACSLDCTGKIKARIERREEAKRGRIALATSAPHKSAGNIAFPGGQEGDPRSSVWRTLVSTPYGPAAWVSVTRAKPLSSLERGALALWTPPEGIDAIPGRAEAIRNAVATELGNRDFVDMPAEAEPRPCPKHMTSEAETVPLAAE